MQKLTLAAVTAAALGAVLLTGCADLDDDRDRCATPVVMFFSTVDHTYHYGSVTGKKVPASKVPSSARKVPGYKPYTPPKAQNTNPKAPGYRAPSVGKPGPAYKAPAPRSGKR